MTPEQLAKAGTEHAHQCALMAWCALNQEQYPGINKMFAIPNGGERNPVVAARLKAEGVRAGIPDLFLPLARHGVHGLFIEMKKPGSGRLSKPQIERSEELLADGYGWAACWGWEEARDVLVQYLT